MLTAKDVGDTGLFFYFDRQRMVIDKYAAFIREKKGALVLAQTMDGQQFVSINHWFQFFVSETDGNGIGLHRFANFSAVPFDPENDVPFLVTDYNNPDIVVWLCDLRDLWSIRLVEQDPNTGVTPGGLAQKAPKAFLSFANIRDAIHYKLRWF